MNMSMKMKDAIKKTINTNKVRAIFGIAVLVVFIGAMSGLSSMQAAYADRYTKSCEFVKITSPADGSRLSSSVATFNGYAKYGNLCLNNVPGSGLKWFRDGVFVGTGNTISIGGFTVAHGVCEYTHEVKLVAEILTPFKHNISTIIHVYPACVG